MRGATIFLTSCSLVIAGCAETQEIRVRAVGVPSKVQFSGGLLAQGRGQLALGNAGTALETFRKLLREQPESADAFAGIAACYVAMGRYDVARTNYEFALAYAPNDVGLLTALASSLDRLGEASQAAGIRAEVAAMRAASAALADAQAPSVASIAVPRVASVTIKVPAAVPIAVQKIAEAEIGKPVLSNVAVTLPTVRPVMLKDASFDTKVAIAIPAVMPDKAPMQTVAVPEFRKPVLSDAAVTLASARPGVLRTKALDSEVAIEIPAVVQMQPTIQTAVAPEVDRPVLSNAAVTLPATRPAMLKKVAFDTEVAIALLEAYEPPLSPGPPKPHSMPAEKPREVAAAAAEPHSDGSPYLTRSSRGVVSLITRPVTVWVAEVAPMARVRNGRASAMLQETAKVAQAKILPGPAPAAVRWMPLKFASAPANIRLLNAARSQSLAGRMRAALLDRGWRKIAIGNARATRLRSLVLYTPTRAAVARRLAAHFGCKAVKVQGAERVIVLLGRDAISRNRGMARA